MARKNYFIIKEKSGNLVDLKKKAVLYNEWSGKQYSGYSKEKK